MTKQEKEAELHTQLRQTITCCISEIVYTDAVKKENLGQYSSLTAYNYNPELPEDAPLLITGITKVETQTDLIIIYTDSAEHRLKGDWGFSGLRITYLD